MCLLLFLSPYIIATQRSHRCHVISYALVMIIKSSNHLKHNYTKLKQRDHIPSQLRLTSYLQGSQVVSSMSVCTHIPYATSSEIMINSISQNLVHLPNSTWQYSWEIYRYYHCTLTKALYRRDNISIVVTWYYEFLTKCQHRSQN